MSPLVAYVALRKANAGRDGQKLFAAYVVDFLRLERGADNAVKPCVLRGLGVVHDNFVYRLFYQKIALHRLLIGGGQLGHGDEQGTRAVRVPSGRVSPSRAASIMRDVPAAWRLRISTSSRESTAMLFLTVFGIS